MGSNARASRAAQVRRRRTLIAAVCTVVVAVVFAVVVLAMRDAGPAASSDQPAGDAAEPASGTVGTVFPEFTLTNLDGTRITNASVATKTTLIWFTDSSCPDADGVARTAALDDELGGEAFQVIAVLVNLHQPSPVAGEWREAFGRPDWLVAPDERGALSAAVGLRALETKFLLDEQGKVVDVSTDLITDQYLNLLREKATA